MTADIPSLLQPLKDRLAAATPGPWFAIRYYVGAGSDQTDPHTEVAKASFKPDAEFIASAPTDQAKLIAAIEAILEVHKPATLWMTHEDADVSYQTKEDVLAERQDLTEDDLVPFDLCSHCKMIEDSPCEGQCTMEAGYRESLYPCPTVAALTQALGGG